MSEQNAIQKRPIDKFKEIISSQSVQEQFQNSMKESAPLFVASLIDIFTNDKSLQECQPQAVVMEALKAATLKLPINKQLGFAWIIARKEKGVPKPAFQVGWKGYVQLALRTAQYRFINAGPVFEGEYKGFFKMTGEVDLTGARKSDTAIGYFAYFRLLNGFEKADYWTKEEVLAHAKRYVPGFSNPRSAWHTNVDEMSTKTVLMGLLRKYGILSVEMVHAFMSDADDRTPEERADDTIRDEANQGDVIDISDDPETEKAAEKEDPKPAETKEDAPDPNEPPNSGPGY